MDETSRGILRFSAVGVCTTCSASNTFVVRGGIVPTYIRRSMIFQGLKKNDKNIQRGVRWFLARAWLEEREHPGAVKGHSLS